MTKLMHHLSSEERDKITILQGEGLSIRKIVSPMQAMRKERWKISTD